MIDRQIDGIQEVDGTRRRRRRECIHIIRDVRQVDQSVRLGGELFGGDQGGCCLSDVGISLESYDTAAEFGGHLLIESERAIRLEFDALTHPGRNHA